MAPQPRIVIIDDHSLVRETLAEFLTAEGFHVVGHTGDPRDALAFVGSHVPQAVVLDWRLGSEVTGGDVLMDLRQRFPGLAVVILSARPEEARDAYKLGAHAVVAKDLSDLDALPRALLSAVGGSGEASASRRPHSASSEPLTQTSGVGDRINRHHPRPT